MYHDIDLLIDFVSILQVLIVGKFSKSKGSFDLIHSFEDWISESWEFRKTFHLIYVGEIESEWFEPLRTKFYRSTHHNLGIRVHAIGAVYSVDRMRKFYAGADVFILNSYCEAFGRVILEAFATGVPVLAKNCGGPSEVIRNMTTGLLYNTGVSFFAYKFCYFC